MRAVDLMSVADIAAMLNVSRQRADQLTRYKGFPEPVAAVNNGRMRIWRTEDVEAWKRENRSG